MCHVAIIDIFGDASVGRFLDLGRVIESLRRYCR